MTAALAALEALDTDTMLAPGYAHAQADGGAHGAFVTWTWALFARAYLAVGLTTEALILADRLDAIPFPATAAGGAARRFAWREADRIRSVATEILAATTVPSGGAA